MDVSIECLCYKITVIFSAMCVKFVVTLAFRRPS